MHSALFTEAAVVSIQLLHMLNNKCFIGGSHSHRYSYFSEVMSSLDLVSVYCYCLETFG